VKPVRPPSSIPAVDSMKAPVVVVPRRGAAVCGAKKEIPDE